MNSKDEPPSRKTLVDLLRKIGTQTMLLARKELALFKTETSAGIKSETSMVIFLILAAGFGILASITLIATIIIALQYYMPLWIAALIVFAVLLLCSLLLVFIGLKKTIKSPWVRTREVIRSDIKIAKGGLA